MTKTAILAGGCFWCTEAVFKQLDGVEAVESGYIGGTTANPGYKEVCSGCTGHAEAVRVSFDPGRISHADLLDVFFATHDPTQLNRQGNDIGTQYRSALFVADEEEQREAEAAIARAAADHADPIVTSIEAAGPFYPAEDYHQDYWERAGAGNPYCIATIPPKLKKLKKGFGERLKDPVS